MRIRVSKNQKEQPPSKQKYRKVRYLEFGINWSVRKPYVQITFVGERGLVTIQMQAQCSRSLGANLIELSDTILLTMRHKDYVPRKVHRGGRHRWRG